jgi:hypothetical protein
MIKKLLPVLILCHCFLFLSGQTDEANDSMRKQYFNPKYIMSYKGDLTTRLYFLGESVRFQINPLKSGVNLTYVPSSNLKFGIAGFYKWFGLGLAVRNPFHFRKTDGKPEKSSILDLRVNAYGTALSAEIVYQDYKGFYLNDPEQVIPGWEQGDDYPWRGDLTISSFSAIIYYLTNYRKHSSRAAYIQTERQLKSAGSPVIAPAIIHLALDADSSLIPSSFLEDHGVDLDESIVNGKFTSMGLSAGYSYTFVFLQYFYINLNLVPGMYYQWYTYRTDEKTIQGSAWTVLWTARGAMGYNSDRIYAGISAVAGYKSDPLPIGNSDFNLDMSQFRVWIGTRFNISKKNKRK